jgi:hypothetical protein
VRKVIAATEAHPAGEIPPPTCWDILFKTVQPTCYWWFAYTMLLKLVINVIFLLGKTRDFRWGMWLQITLVASALISHWFRPYVLMNDNRFEQLVFLCIACALSVLNSRTAAEVRRAPCSAQKSGRRQPFVAVFPQECMGQLASFEPNLTPLSLEMRTEWPIQDTLMLSLITAVMLGCRGPPRCPALCVLNPDPTRPTARNRDGSHKMTPPGACWAHGRGWRA